MKRTSITIKYLSITVISFCCLSLPLVSNASSEKIAHRKITQVTEMPHSAEGELVPGSPSKEQFQVKLDELLQIVENSIILLESKQSEIQNNQTLNTEIKYQILQRIEKDLEFLQTQQSILENTSNADSLKIVAHRLDAYIKNHRDRVQEIRENYINTNAATKIRQAQEKAKEVITGLHKISIQLQEAGADTAKLDAMITTLEETVSSMSFLDADENPETVINAMLTLRTDLRNIISLIQSLIKKTE